LDSSNSEKLENKYLITIIRNLIFHLRKNRVMNKNSNSIRKENLIKFLKIIGYKNYSSLKINKLLNDFCLSIYVKSYDTEYIAIKDKYSYESLEKEYLVYEYDIKNEKFTFSKFKQEVIEFLYSKPSIINTETNKHKQFINFTTQKKVAEKLNISQETVSQRTKNINKLYAFKIISNKNYIRTWEEAVGIIKFLSETNPGRYSIVTDYKNTKVGRFTKKGNNVKIYHIIKLEGSRLAIVNKEYKRYKNNKKFKSIRGKLKIKKSNKYNSQIITEVANNRIGIHDGKQKRLIYSHLLRVGTSSNSDGTFNDYFYLYGPKLELQKSNIHLYDYTTKKNYVKKLNSIINNNVNNVNIRKINKKLMININRRKLINQYSINSI